MNKFERELHTLLFLRREKMHTIDRIETHTTLEKREFAIKLGQKRKMLFFF